MKILEVGNPKRTIVKNKEEYLRYITKYNGVCNLYETIYLYTELNEYEKINYSSAIVNQLFFDLDSINSWENAKKMHKYLLENDIKHYMKQSSYMKFHVFVMCEIEKLNNKKVAISNASLDLANKIGLSIGKSSEADIDKAVIGDLARFTAIPGTYKPKRKCWCNYIDSNILNSQDKLKSISFSCDGIKTYYGEKCISLKPFDGEKVETFNIAYELDEVELNLPIENIIKTFPPFIMKVLNDEDGHGMYENRWRFCIYCRETGISMKKVYEIAEKYFSQQNRKDNIRNNFEHMKRNRIIESVYLGVEKYKFPPIGKIRDEGWTINEEDEKILSNLYFKGF